MLTICTNQPQRRTARGCEPVKLWEGAWDSSAKQNWNLRTVSKAATEEPAGPPFPTSPLPVSWMHSPLRWGSRPRSRTSSWRGCGRTDGLLTDWRRRGCCGRTWSRIYRRKLERVRRRREDISVGWLKRWMSCFASYLPSPVLSLPLSATFPTHGRAPPTRLRCQSEAGLSHLFHLFLPPFLYFCLT